MQKTRRSVEQLTESWKQAKLGSVATARVGESGARLTCYSPRVHQKPHDHDEAHVSVILSGSVVETTSRADLVQASSGMMRVRSGGFRHETLFGAHGALIVVLPFHQEPDPALAQLEGWCSLARPFICRRTLQELLLGGSVDLRMTIAELAACCLPMLTRVSRPPAWLAQARDKLMEEPAGTNISALAEQAGVHRVYFTRLFTACFGLPPSVYRRRAMLERALCAMLHNHYSPAEAALRAGFADQSHFTRTARDFLGVPPARLRLLWPRR